jgi:hypothetical protein
MHKCSSMAWSVPLEQVLSTAYGYCVGLITPASLAGDYIESISRAQHHRQFGGVRPGLPGSFAACGTRGVFTAHGT